MGTFVPTTAAEREQMLRTIGVSSVEDLFLSLIHISEPTRP